MKSQQKVVDAKQEELREQFWPNFVGQIWRSSDEKGYFCAPRSLPLILRLLAEEAVVGSPNCATVYVDLFSRVRINAVVDLGDPGEHAYAAGYSGARAIRSWKERMRALEAAGFIRIAAKPNQEFGIVLIRHPHLVVTELRTDGRIDDAWWQAYEMLQRNHSASSPSN
jgi:hypothetical protein